MHQVLQLGLWIKADLAADLWHLTVSWVVRDIRIETCRTCQGAKKRVLDGRAEALFLHSVKNPRGSSIYAEA